jgi:ArsR family metal-binding transcriptional regulator|uniref:Fe-S cluster protein n=1 Tax=Desulfobacca acetoxidans TaxID=60893 RepID=A0A7C3YZF6_9BACT
MLLKSYQLEYCRPPNPGATHLRAFARLEVDIAEILPHLNTVLRGHLYMREPPSLTIKYQAKLITFHPQEIAINIVKDQTEAEDILAWLQGVINDTWARRETITPSFEVPPKPHLLEILKLLPRTNCRACGQPTCLVFATRLSAGEATPEDCPRLPAESQVRLQGYLGQFQSFTPA